MQRARTLKLFVFLFWVPLAIAQPLRPAALHPGDTVALITPSHSVSREQVQFAAERLQALGLNVEVAPTLLEEFGQFAGTAKSRAREINRAFASTKVKALFAVRGGSGAGNVLPYLDFKLIRKNPKIVMGFSDITALLLGINTKTDLITYHGPVVGFPMPGFTVDYLKAVLFNAETPLTLANPRQVDTDADLIQSADRTFTITPGQAKGRLIGGNLTVLTSLLGSEYLPKDWTNTILFIEDVSEEIYRIDVMLGQLENAGILKQIKGFVFGTCEDCATNTFHSFRLEQVLDRYIKPLNIPAYRGALIGHQPNQFSLPIGVLATLDATQGTITLLQKSTTP